MNWLQSSRYNLDQKKTSLWSHAKTPQARALLVLVTWLGADWITKNAKARAVVSDQYHLYIMSPCTYGSTFTPHMSHGAAFYPSWSTEELIEHLVK